MLPLSRMGTARTGPGEDALRTIAAVIVILVCALPALFAGLPGTEPGWFDVSWQGAPLCIVAMCGLMAFLALMAKVCAEVSKDRPLPGRGAE